MKRERIGSVTVDSGMLIIVDPCYFDQRRLGVANYKAVCAAARGSGDPSFAEIVVAPPGGAAVITATPASEKSFPVFAEIEENGEVARIVIDIATVPGQLRS